MNSNPTKQQQAYKVNNHETLLAEVNIDWLILEQY